MNVQKLMNLSQHFGSKYSEFELTFADHDVVGVSHPKLKEPRDFESDDEYEQYCLDLEKAGVTQIHWDSYYDSWVFYL